jgi:hypothetical protein
MKQTSALSACAVLSRILLLALPLGALADNITVFSTVIFSRVGERTPVLNLANETVHLTSYGASQMYEMVGSINPRPAIKDADIFRALGTASDTLEMLH